MPSTVALLRQVRCQRRRPVYGSGKGFAVLNVILAVALVAAALVGLAATIRARQGLRRARADSSRVLDALGFGVLLLRSDGTVQYANSAGADILSRYQTQIVSKPFHQLLHEGATANQRGGVEVAMRLHQPYRGLERFVDGDGRPVPVTVAGMPLDDSRMVIAFRDCSNDIAQGRQRDEAFALVSHEVRGPLTTVVGYSARLRAAVTSGALNVNAQRGEEITLLAREAQRLREIILLVLDVAEIERSSVAVEVEPVQVNRLVQAEIDRIRLDRPAVSMALVAGDDVVVESDERYVRRIVQSLLDNAARYGGDAEAVEVTLKQDEGAGCWLTVRDHGAGIPADAQSRVFERFYRHESAPAHGRGLGLGLYLSRRLALRLGGQLTFTSTPGEGATFSLTLPAVCPDAPPPERSEAVGALFP